MPRKDLYLFGFRIFSIVTEPDPDPEQLEEDEDLTGLNPLHPTIELSTGDTPIFGFIDWKNYPYGDDEE
jgi:hypothetical protein